MTPANLTSLALAFVAILGSTGCGCHRYRTRWVHMPVREPGVVYYHRGAPAPPPPPIQAEMAPPPVAPAGPRPIVIYANVPQTTVIVINPTPGGAPIVQQVGPYYRPQAPVAPPPQQPEVQPQQNPDGWFEGE